jgi:hypothetical protein
MSRTNFYEYTDSGLEALAIAITQQAAYDYQEELERSKEAGCVTQALKDIRNWFKSEFGTLCSFGQSEFIINQIDHGVKVKPYGHFVGTPHSLLSEEDVKFILEHYKPRDKKYNLTSLGKMFGVSTTYMWNLINGR